MRVVAVASLLVSFSFSSTAQEPATYGNPITLEHALKVLEAAKAEAVKQKWAVAIVIVDGGGHPIAFQKLDNTQHASIEVAMAKAKSAALFRRATKVFEDTLAAGGAGLRVLKVPGAIPVEGGIPLVHEGKVIGAIGVSGVKPNEDGQVAQAGATIVK